MKGIWGICVVWMAGIRSTRGWILPSTEVRTPSWRLFSYRQHTPLITNATNHATQQRVAPREDEAVSRRIMFATSLFVVGSTLGVTSSSAASFATNADIPKPPISFYAPDSKLIWEPTPINKRTGITVFDAESFGYNVQFVTYLAHFLLTFDQDCQRWWYGQAKSIPRTAKENEIEEQRSQQFAAFSASVEVGLQEYRGNDGPASLLKSLVKKYGTISDISTSNELSTDNRTAKEARRQIALLFALMKTNQPVEEITKLLAAIDNGTLSNGVTIISRGSGYAKGYGPPKVRFPPPDAGSGYEQAQGRAVLSPTGRILRLDVVNRGSGYKSPPKVTIAPPSTISRPSDQAPEPATAKALLFRSGPNKGKVQSIEIINPGARYAEDEIITVRLSPPETSDAEGGQSASAVAILEYEVSGIDLLSNGTGYAVEKPISVDIEPPPFTSRVNMNDPIIIESILGADGKTDPQRLEDFLLSEVTNATSAAKRSNMLGRLPKNTPASAVAYAKADRLDSYTSSFESQGSSQFVSGRGEALSNLDSPQFGVQIRGTPPRSTQLQALIPAGVGLVFDYTIGQYSLAVDPDFVAGGFFFPSSQKYQTFDPEFGPRGRTPIERDMDLGFPTYLRFLAAGAICSSGVHLALTPIDVVKTKVQTDPENFPNLFVGFKKVFQDGGLSEFFRGWAPTFVGFFFWGGFAFAITEALRRLFQSWVMHSPELAGMNLEVPIIVASAGLAAIVGSCVICPFEAVRIRSVAQPDYGKNAVDICSRMVREEGIKALFSAVPVFLAKEIPFAIAKFTVFDLSTEYLYREFPAATEDIQLSLLVSLAGGTLGGIAAGIVSNPADATISEMKKGQSSMGPVQAVTLVLEKGGIGGLFRGLPLRLIFYSLMISMQFLVYDAVRIALGVGSDDLKLYLDVLGGVLKDS